MIERINKIKKYDPRLRSEMKLLAYERENAWWYHFFQAAGSSSYDAEYANSLRALIVP